MALGEGDVMRNFLKMKAKLRKEKEDGARKFIEDEIKEFLRNNPNVSMSPDAQEVASDFAGSEDIPKNRTYIKPTEVRLREKED